jgi:hypothetical protein
MIAFTVVAVVTLAVAAGLIIAARRRTGQGGDLAG